MNAPKGAAFVRTEASLADFVDTAALGLHCVAKDGTILWANAADYEPLGYRADEYIGHNVEEFHADAATIADILARLGRGERLQDYPARLVAKDGSVRDVQITSSALFDERGEFVHTRCFTRDVTDSTHAEQMERAEHENLRRVMDALPVLVSWVDADGRYKLVNRAYQDWFGIAREEIEGRSLAEVLGESAYATIRESVNKALSGERVTYEATIPYRAGGTRDVRAMYVPQLDSRGRTLGFVALVSDVTEARRTETRLSVLAEASAAFAREADDATHLCQRIADTVAHHVGDGCVIQLLGDNSEVLEPLGVADRDPEAERMLREVMQTSPLKLGEGVTGTVAKTGEQYVDAKIDRDVLLSRVTPEYRAYAERYTPHSLIVLPLRTRERTVGVLSLSRVQTSAAYDEHDLRLAQDLADRAAMALDISLALARERTAVKARDDFLQIAGHELRTPLSALQLQVQSLLLQGTANLSEARMNDRLERLERNTLRLAKLIEELLDVSRIAGGRLRLAVEDVELEPLVREVVERFADEAAKAGSALSVDAPSGIVGSWDRARLDQILTNLIENAIKYGAGKPIDVRVTSRDGTARIEVEDRGIGISPAARERIFGRFERAVSERHYGGLGLGLWICRRIVDAMHGRISLESTEGEGTTFRVDLPLGSEEPS